MAKRPLRQWMRDKLLTHATKSVKPATEAKALDAAYRKAAPLVRRIVEAKYKPTDMIICEKYDLAQRDMCIRTQHENGSVDEFSFADRETSPLTPKGNCYGRMYLADEKASAAIEAWVKATEVYKAEVAKRIAAYTALLQSSSTLDDVIALWPEAATIIPENNAMILFNPEQVALLQADLKERKVAA